LHDLRSSIYDQNKARMGRTHAEHHGAREE
jgi:hypothetical protein